MAELCDDGALDATLSGVVDTLLRARAADDVAASKAAVARLRRAALPDDPIGEDLVADAFGSDDFQRAVAGFGAKAPATWRGA